MIAAADSGFHRVARESMSVQLNDALLQGYFGLRSYHSFHPGSVLRFLGHHAFDPPYQYRRTGNSYINGLGDRYALETLLSVGYALAPLDPNPPAPGYERWGRAGNVAIWRNRFFVPLGSVYREVVSEEQMSGVAPEARDLIALTAAIVPAFTPLVRNRWILATVVPVLGLAGMNHVFYLITLTFQMYVVVLILLTILFLQSPKTTAGLVVQCLLAVFLVYSGPYSVVAVPTCLLLLLFFRDRRKQILWGVVAIAGFAYNRMTPGMARFDNLFDPEIVGKMVTVTFEQVLFLDVGGSLELWKIAVFFLLLVPAAIIIARDPVRLRTCLVLLALVLLALTPLFLSRKFFFYSDPAPCHVLISRFFWIFLLIHLLDGLVERLPRFRVGFSLAVVATMVFYIWGDTQIRPWKFDYPRTRSVSEFMETIRRAENLGLKERNEFMMLAFDGNPVNPFGPRVRVGSQKSGATRVPAIGERPGD